MRRAATMGIVVALSASGCATVVDGPVRARVGQPIHTVIAELGTPSSERIIAGRTVYTWTRSRSTNGNRLECTLNYTVDEGGVVVDADWNGQLGACSFGGFNPFAY